MLKTIAPAEMKRVENHVMAATAITGEMLMQRAAAHVAQAVRELCCGSSGVVLCVCATGNNGGDGMAAMRMLAQQDGAFQGECWVLPGRLSADAQRELDRLRATSVRIRMIEDTLPPWPEHVICAIDALFGTGLCRPLEGLALEACRLLNRLDAPVVAVDIPSGLNGLTGDVLGEAVHAQVTITFHRPKPGLYLGQGPDYAGRIGVVDIGIPPALDDADGFAVMERSDPLLPARRRVSHKGSYGRVLLWAGSRGMAGAAAIAATAALRTGAGLVTVACPEAVVDIVQVLCPCATCLPLPKEPEKAWPLLEEALLRTDSLGAGCGLGQSPETAQLLDLLLNWLEQHALPAVLDADALNLLAKRGGDVRAQSLFITPHPAEAARLLGTDVRDAVEDAAGAALQLREKLNASVILKGACSVLRAQDGAAINPFGTPAMAKGGSGDALTGVLAALLAGRAAGAYAMNDLTVLQTACALHGLAGEMAAAQHGERGMLATELCECIGLVKPDGPKCSAAPPTAIGRDVTVVVEHAAGTRDENRRLYPLNLGYVQQVLDEENRWQDACIWGEKQPLEWFDGRVIAAVHAGGKCTWVVAANGVLPDEKEIKSALGFLGDVQRVENC